MSLSLSTSPPHLNETDQPHASQAFQSCTERSSSCSGKSSELGVNELLFLHEQNHGVNQLCGGLPSNKEPTIVPGVCGPRPAAPASEPLSQLQRLAYTKHPLQTLKTKSDEQFV
jgi:hypothetical protein